MVRGQCGFAAKQDGSHAPANLGSKTLAIWSAARHSEQLPKSASFSNPGGERSVPDHRWLVDDDPRIHPVCIVNVQTHNLRHAPSLDQLLSPTLSTEPAGPIRLQSRTPPDDDGVQQVATEAMLGTARELTITKQQPVLRDVGRPTCSSGMASSDRSGKESQSGATSRPTSSSRQNTTQSARHQPSFSEFYAYVESDYSLPGSANGSWASYNDYQASEARSGQGDTRSDAGLSCAGVSPPSGQGLDGSSTLSGHYSGDHETGLAIPKNCSPPCSGGDSAMSGEDYEEHDTSQILEGGT
ncbi:uncharacterized protein LY79DRAFT_356288 [Colletotrichum navitas]|uniref:Uncharacterized protein n=1 Tax=Colletotrichum navitas TaxID=681940 RepID=A0AAD8V834_9PEZI|nr:uncharacterized protein LY79DRAFT_356288 [Colletotrichum navitas]KAK1597782.1 hypothetical protein LY79DRAFT_356288 [Colletotrichum navitas]